MDITEEQVTEYIQKLRETDPILAYILTTYSQAFKNIDDRIKNIENQKREENN